eukprot:CAMPEP_0181389022 /NCGR_PEP_ID=MMETSP1106-20121128/24655_1 /TAXON_ID=81844 /ORGANISM="Mantoniella antarctica, Strain SL-175" /LENGTH=49 /DNA_ID=CAMNT_0023509689 /DNA_START=68 /DNA_END=220 /DNA_ORIENTATION=+
MSPRLSPGYNLQVWCKGRADVRRERGPADASAGGVEPPQEEDEGLHPVV